MPSSGQRRKGTRPADSLVGSTPSRGPGRRGPVRNFFWHSDGSAASRSSMSQDTAGAGRRDNGVVDDAVPDLVRCPCDGPHP